MLKPCNFRSQCQLSDHPMLSCPFTKTNCYSLRSSIWLPKPPCFSSLIRRQQSITCAERSKRRGGAQPSIKLMLELASMLALNLKILPQPLNLLIEEFAQRDANGVLLGFLNILRGRASNDWRRKRQTRRILSWFVLILICGLGLVCWKISEFELFLRVMCFCLAGLSMIQLWRKKAFKEWILGFLLGVVLLSSRMGKKDVKVWVERLRIRSPVALIVIGNRNRNRRKCRKAW